MKQIRKRLTYANAMSSIAVFLLLGGAGALAASKKGSAVPRNSVGTKQLKTNAVSTEKIKPEAITKQKLRTAAVITAKIADSAVTSSKLQDGAIGSAEIAEGAVSGSKLEPSERSEAVAFSASSSFDLFDSYEPANWTTVMSLGLPDGKWVLSANLSLSISTNVPTHVGCRMSQNGATLAQGGTEGERVSAGVASFDGVELSALAGAGQVIVTCGDTLNGVTALNRSLIATRAGSVSAG
jgi:hypothetical protein